MKRDMTVTSGGASENMFGGDKLYQQRARAALPILVQCAKARKTIMYKELGSVVSMTDLRSIGRVCGSVAAPLSDLQEYWDGNAIPRITNLVIRQNGRPGAGVCGQLTGDWEKHPTRRIRCLIGGHL